MNPGGGDARLCGIKDLSESKVRGVVCCATEQNRINEIKDVNSVSLKESLMMEDELRRREYLECSVIQEY